MLSSNSLSNHVLWERGNKRVFRLKAEYEKLGWKVVINPSNHEGPDLILISNPEGKIVKVIESTNYARTSNVHKDNFKRYVETLDYFDFIIDIEKILVISFRENLSPSQWRICIDHHIKVEVLGFQD
jgi:hypothetical protein